MASPPLEPGATARQLVQPRVSETWPSHGIGACRTIQGQLPELTSLPSGAWVGVTGGSRERAGLWAKLFGQERGSRVHLAVRCMALQLAGYRDVCAADDVAFGRVP